MKLTNHTVLFNCRCRGNNITHTHTERYIIIINNNNKEDNQNRKDNQNKKRWRVGTAGIISTFVCKKTIVNKHII